VISYQFYSTTTRGSANCWRPRSQFGIGRMPRTPELVFSDAPRQQIAARVFPLLSVPTTPANQAARVSFKSWTFSAGTKAKTG